MIVICFLSSYVVNLLNKYKLNDVMKNELKNWIESGKYLNYNGYKIFYNQFGEGPDIIILHGYPYSSYEWKNFIPLLSQYYRVTVFDFLGFGFSDKPENHLYSFQEYVKILNLVVLNLQIKEAHLLTHDLGVSVAQEVLANYKHEENLFSIQSICFSNGNLFSDVYKPRLIQRILSQTPNFIGRFISRHISKASVNKTIRSLYGKKTQPDEAFLDELWDVLNYNNGKNISYLLGKLVFEKALYLDRWTLAMRGTEIPLCYICGPADMNSGIDMAIAFQKRVPNGTLIWMDDSIGHWPMIEDSDSFLKYYLDWISTQVNRKLSF